MTIGKTHPTLDFGQNQPVLEPTDKALIPEKKYFRISKETLWSRDSVSKISPTMKFENISAHALCRRLDNEEFKHMNHTNS